MFLESAVLGSDPDEWCQSRKVSGTIGCREIKIPVVVLMSETSVLHAFSLASNQFFVVSVMHSFSLKIFFIIK